MRGEFKGVRPEIIKHIFEPMVDEIAEYDFENDELLSDLLREAIPQPIEPPMPKYKSYDANGNVHLDGDIKLRGEYQDALSRYNQRVEAYNDATSRSDLAWKFIVTFFEDPDITERQIIGALEDSFDTFEEYGGDALATRYFHHVEGFLEKFSLRYDLRRPANGNGMSLYPTLPGMFARLIRDLKEVTNQDADMADLMHEFEECIRDLRTEQSARKIKQCLVAQFNLLEGLLKSSPDVVAFNNNVAAHNKKASGNKQRKPADTFGVMCDKANVWPHKEVLVSAKSIYKFGSDYPGLRHSGNRANAKRDIDMRDMVSLTIVLAGFAPYLCDALDADKLYLE